MQPLWVLGGFLSLAECVYILRVVKQSAGCSRWDHKSVYGSWGAPRRVPVGMGHSASLDSWEIPGLGIEETAGGDPAKPWHWVKWNQGFCSAQPFLVPITCSAPKGTMVPWVCLAFPTKATAM